LPDFPENDTFTVSLGIFVVTLSEYRFTTVSAEPVCTPVLTFSSASVMVP
jgi:hypothetical protein